MLKYRHIQDGKASKKFGFAMVLICLAMTNTQSIGQQFVPNYDESKVPSYELPELMKFIDGRPVEEVTQWEERQREIIELFKVEMFGDSPPEIDWTAREIESSDNAFEGRAIRRQIRLTLAREHSGNEATDKVELDVLVYLPKSVQKPVPVFLALNFRGNHSIGDDPDVLLPVSWVPNDNDFQISDNRTNEKVRGSRKSRWPVEKILENGFGLVTCYYGDIDPDFDDGFQNGVHGLFPHTRRPPQPLGHSQPESSYSWGSIAAWAWGLSRIMDYLETDDAIDHRRVALMGHSRLGKTALWAGATDPRFGVVISNNSGCGGAAISRRRYGETVARINRAFPHWFNERFKKYADNEDQLPVDQHLLIAAIAPRPVYIASAEGDRWADPLGEFLAALHADPAYRLHGLVGIEVDQQPPINQPEGQTIGYHIRSGDHDVTDFDWDQYLRFAQRHLVR